MNVPLIALTDRELLEETARALNWIHNTPYASGKHFMKTYDLVAAIERKLQEPEQKALPL